MGRLAGKTAIVTGAARGQGEATSRLFVKEGANVVMTDVLVDEGKALAAELGERALFVEADISTDGAWTAITEAAISRFGRIDVLINNAAISDHTSFADMTAGHFQKILAINVIAPYMGIKAVTPYMLRQGGGSIVNISSVNGLRATQGMSAYDCSKWAVRGMAKAGALEYGARGIRVNSIHPGAIRTPMLDPTGNRDGDKLAGLLRIVAGRVGEPDEVAYASLFLASDEASYVNGAELAVDGGWSAGMMIPPEVAEL